MARTKVFVSYSHVDREWRDRLRTHFAVLEHKGVIETWMDTRIIAGAAWETEIDEALTQCQLAVLLVTPNFLASEFIQRVEVASIMQRHSQDGLSIVPVIARPCAWQLVDFLRGVQCRPDGGRALSLGSEAQIDEDLTLLTYELGHLVSQSSPVRDIRAGTSRALNAARYREAVASILPVPWFLPPQLHSRQDGVRNHCRHHCGGFACLLPWNAGML